MARVPVRTITVHLGDDGKLEVRTQYDEAFKDAIKDLGDRRSRTYDRQRKAWVVARSRLVDVVKTIYKVYPGAEIRWDPRLYAFSDCRNGHSTFDVLDECPECGESVINHRGGIFNESERQECISRCFDARNDECNCVCLGKCHGLGRCSGGHKPSDWQKAGVTV